MKFAAKFGASRRLSFEDTKRIMSPQMGPKRFRTFEKWALEEAWNPDLCNAGDISQSHFFFFYVFPCGGDHIKRMWEDRVWGKTI